jgi:hypothetical protein
VVAGPDAELVEVAAADGSLQLAIVYPPEYRELAAQGLAQIVKFVELPMVPGLAPLAERMPEEGAYVYPSGPTWTLAEVLEELAGVGAGAKAGLELCERAALIVQEAAVVGHEQGAFSHGSLSPWRVLLDKVGNVTLIGYGLAPVEVLAFLQREDAAPSEAAFRYAPPERLRGDPEDVSSDALAIALMSIELMLGRPVYDGALDELFEQAETAPGGARLAKTDLPELVREVLAPALEGVPEKRFRDALELADVVKELLGTGEVEGPGLTDVMAEIALRRPATAAKIVDPEAGKAARAAAADARAAADDARSLLELAADEIAAGGDAAAALGRQADEALHRAIGAAETAEAASDRGDPAGAAAAAELALGAAADVLAHVEEAQKLAKEHVAREEEARRAVRARAVEAASDHVSSARKASKAATKAAGTARSAAETHEATGAAVQAEVAAAEAAAERAAQALERAEAAQAAVADADAPDAEIEAARIAAEAAEAAASDAKEAAGRATTAAEAEQAER